jgi:pimeloyl-ACP methyl ester carboxylesterase/DNA-binding CsgD family transcriptional regulator
VKQRIQFCRSSDGARIALASIGAGLPLLCAAHRLSRIESDVRSPVWAPWLRELSRNHTLIRYDPRGSGLSERMPDPSGLDSWIEDLEAVTDKLSLKRFALLGMSLGGPVAIAYASRYPERVSHLVLLGAYARGRLRRSPSSHQHQEAQALRSLISMGWSEDNPAFRHIFASLLMPEGKKERRQWLDEFQATASAHERVAAVIEALFHVDVSAAAEAIQVPTLICHGRHDAMVPFEEGRFLAGLIPSARFVPLHTANHVLLHGEPAWSHFFAELEDFLSVPDDAPRTTVPRRPRTCLTPTELEVLALVAQGLDNRTIAEVLSKGEKTVRNQVSAILAKLNVRTRAEAIVFAREQGIVTRKA